MPLLSLKNASLAFGHMPLLDKVGFQLNAGERVCLLGRNGEGKSTLLKVLAGLQNLDDGEFTLSRNMKIAYLTQEVPESSLENSLTVLQVVLEGLGEIGLKIFEYEKLTKSVEVDVDRLSALQASIDSEDGWLKKQCVEKVLSRFKFEGEELFNDLSGGLKRRVLLARALANDPEILLLDEPTNHLDIASILWLEQFLLTSGLTLIFVSHDRSFLSNLATRIVELDRGKLTTWPGNYDEYLKSREVRLQVEKDQKARFEKKLAEEEVWIRQGIKARRTRNEGRARALEALRKERANWRKQVGKVKLQLSNEISSGKVVIEARDVDFKYDNKELIKSFSTTILRGDKLGIVGPNGVGKTTLVKLLLGQLRPDSGTIKLGTKLEVAYFDQLRSTLNEDASVVDNVAEGSDLLTINGKSKHVMSYLQDFLFSPERARSPVSALSGGEKNRLLLAKLFTRSANFLVMDEPTNDLDVETLELLEELLLEFKGTLILISHDRMFLNRVVTQVLVFEGQGRVAEYVGGYQDFMVSTDSSLDTSAVDIYPKDEIEKLDKPENQSKKKMSYKDKRELELLPEKIEQLEANIEEIQTLLSHPDTYKSDPENIPVLQEKLNAKQKQLAEYYQRWETLDDF